MTSVSRKDLVKELRATFQDGDVHFEHLRLPDDLLQVISDFLSINENLSKDDATKLATALSDINASVASQRRDDQGGYGAWIVILSRLCLETSEILPCRPELAEAIWSNLLKPIFVENEHHIHLHREALKAAKELLIHICTFDTPSPPSSKSQTINVVAKSVCSQFIALKQGSGKADILEEVLVAAIKRVPEVFLRYLQNSLAQTTKRLPILELLFSFLRQHPNLAHQFQDAGLISDLTLCFLAEMEPLILQLTLNILLALLTSLVTSMKEHIPALLACYAKAVSLYRAVLQRQSLHSDYSTVNTNGMPTVDLPLLNSDIRWAVLTPRKDGHMLTVLLPADRFFTYLYGIIPCNFVAFLTAPRQALRRLAWTSPFDKKLDEPCLDLNMIVTNSEFFFACHTMQAALLLSSVENEIEDLPQAWAKADASTVITYCETFLAGPSVAMESHRMSESSETRARGNSYQRASISSRSRASSRNRHVGGAESPVQRGDATPPSIVRSLPSSPFVVKALSLDTAISANDALKRADLLHQVTLHQKDEIRRLRGELHFEHYVKSQHHQNMGALHRQRTLESGFEAERQTLYQALRHMRNQLLEKQSQLDTQRNEASAARASHMSWEAELRNRTKTLKEENRALRAEREGSSTKLASAQDQITQQAAMLEELGSKVFDLSAQAELDRVKLERMQEVEDDLHKMTKALLLTDKDKLVKEQQDNEIEELLSEWQKSIRLNEATEQQMKQLGHTCKELEEKVVNLELQLAELSKKDKASTIPQFQQKSLSDMAYGQLREAYNRIRDENLKLKEKILSGVQETRQQTSEAAGAATESIQG